MLRKDLRFAWRQLARSPWTTAVLAATIGLGVAVNSVMFGLVDTVLLRPLPYPQPDRLLALWEGERGGADRIPVADGNFADLHGGAESLSGVAAWVTDTTLVGFGEATHRLDIAAVTRDFFSVLAVEPVLGRLPAADEHGEGRPAVAVLGHATWLSAFGGRRDLLGRRLTIYGEEAEIVGVMPAGFDYPGDSVLWIDYERWMGDSRTAHNLRAVARLAPGASLAGSREELSQLGARLAAAHPDDLAAGFVFTARPLHEELVGDSRPVLLLLFGIVAVVLLVACGNIAGVLLVRAAGRDRELALRRAVGADGRRIARQFLVEGATIGAVGAAVGVVLGSWALRALGPWVPPGVLPVGELSTDWRFFAYGGLLGVVAGCVCTLAPVWWATRRAPVDDLRQGGGAPQAGAFGRLGSTLIVGQYAFSLAVLVVAGLLVRGLFELADSDPGYATGGAVVAEVVLPTDPPSRYAQPAAVAAFHDELLAAVAGRRGIERVTLVHTLPLSGRRINGLALREGQAMPAPGEEEAYPDYRVVGPDYFATFGMPLIAGRDFAAADREGSPLVAVVNRGLARRLWGGEDPLGRQVVLPGLDFDAERASRPLTIVGLVEDVRYNSLDGDAEPAVYVPAAQHLDRADSLHLVAAVDGDARAWVEPLRHLVRERDPNLPASRVETLDSAVGRALAVPRFRALLLTVFAGLALLLAIVGVYGAMSLGVASRRREMALRGALGASPARLRRLVYSRGARVIVAGQILGTLFAFGLARVAQQQVGSEGVDVWILVVVSLGLALAVLVTCWAPARRAGRVDPALALKEQ